MTTIEKRRMERIVENIAGRGMSFVKTVSEARNVGEHRRGTAASPA
jgi:hypothetical protein